MTVFVDPKDDSAYVLYSSEANATLYIAKLNDDYTNVVKTTNVDQSEGQKQYSADGQYPYILADATTDAPVRGEDFQIVKQNGSLEAPAVFQYDGRYNIIASGATGWAPNKQTYYTADSMLGSWTRGVEKDDVNENTWYNNMPEGADGLLSVGDTRGTTFGSQSASVLAVDQEKGHFIYLGDRWDSGKADSTYVWLPLTIGENGTIEMHNPAQEGEPDGWDLSYWGNHGSAKGKLVNWTVETGDDLPKITGANGGKGYATLLASPSGVYMQYDSNADGYIDKETSHVGTGFGDQVQLKLERTSTDTLKGYWRASANDEWQDVATVTLTGADVTGLDAGAFATSNSNAGAFTVAFNGTAFGSQTAAVESIAAKGPEATIAKGQMLALRDVTVTATLTNGKTRVLEPSEYTLEGFDTTKLGEQTVTVRLVADSSVTATFTVTVESNLARLFCSSAAASKYEPASSWASASTADLTCDNNLSTNWSNWGTGDTSPWLSYTFDKAYQLGKLSVAVDKAKGEAAPKSFTVSYLAEDSATWTDATLPAVTVNGAAGAVTEADVSALPATKGIRLNFTYADGNDYAKIAEVRIAEGEATPEPQPSSNANLADLTVDGKTVDGFSADTTKYAGALAGDAASYPTVEATAADAKATVQVEQASAENNGVATVTVTAEDGTAKTYTVTFGELPQLAELAVEVTKDSYQVGDKFNAADVKVSAIYKVGDTETLRKLIDPTDGDLKFTGFDSATAGTRTITVSYRGVNATFEVTVTATEVTPGPGEQKPGDTNNPGNTAKPGSTATNKPAANGAAPLSNTGAAVAAIAVVVVVLAAAAGALLVIRKRRA